MVRPKGIPYKYKGVSLKERYGKERADEIISKIKHSLKGRKSYLTGKTYEEFWGKEFAEKHKKRLSIIRKQRLKEGKIEVWNKGLTKETDVRVKKNAERTSKGVKRLYDDKKSVYNTKEFREKQLKGLLQRPTSFEQKICDLCITYSLPFIYKGDGSFLINLKNPDFVNFKDKIVIEAFYSWFKIRDYGSVENYKEFCRKKYESAGWRVLFLDEQDIHYPKNWEKICLNKIRHFIKNV